MDTMINVSILIPVAPYHQSIIDRALDSVKAQTTACKCYYMNDDDLLGAGYIRNRLLDMVETPFVVFLDADDWIEPPFVERCLAVYQQGRYVYTDWYQDEQIIRAPERPYCPPQWGWHHIAALLPTEAVRKANGFDETLEAMEDTDLFCKLRGAQVCAQHLKEPLVHYSIDGQRAKDSVESGRTQLLRQELFRRYDGNMGCCLDAPVIDEFIPEGQRQENDVLVMAKWQGNRAEYGRVTGRRYARLSWPRRVWVDIRDAEHSPELWEIIPELLADMPPMFEGLDGFERVLRQTGVMPTPPPLPIRIDRSAVKPDVEKVMRVAKKKLV